MIKLKFEKINWHGPSHTILRARIRVWTQVLSPQCLGNHRCFGVCLGAAMEGNSHLLQVHLYLARAQGPLPRLTDGDPWLRRWASSFLKFPSHLHRGRVVKPASITRIQFLWPLLTNLIFCKLSSFCRGSLWDSSVVINVESPCKSPPAPGDRTTEPVAFLLPVKPSQCLLTHPTFRWKKTQKVQWLFSKAKRGL